MNQATMNWEPEQTPEPETAAPVTLEVTPPVTSKGDTPTAAEAAPDDTSTAVAIIEATPSKELMAMFSNDKGLDPIIKKIKERVKSEELDPTTEKGRQRIGGLARQIGSAKERLKETAEALTEEWRAKTASVNAEKKRMATELDSLRDEVLAKREAYEKAQAERIAAHEAALNEILNAHQFDSTDPLAEHIKARRERVEEVNARDWQEFSERAKVAYEQSASRLDAQYDSRVKRDKDAAELERHRAEQAERDRIENERKQAHTDALEHIRTIGVINPNSTVEQLEALLPMLEPFALRDWQEYADEAKEAATAAESSIKNAIELLNRRAEDAENERIKAEHEQQMVALILAEKERVNRHQAGLDAMTSAGSFPTAMGPSSVIAGRRENLKIIYTRDWQEFAAQAKEIFEAADKKLEVAFDTKVKEEAEAKRLADQKIADDAVQAERDKAAALAEQAAKDTAAREADENHRKKINNEARDTIEKIIMVGAVSKDCDPYKALVIAIAKGEVPHIKIEY